MSFLNIAGLWWKVGLPLEMLRVSMLMVITIVVIHFIVAGWICRRAAGTRPGEGRLHGSVTRWRRCRVLGLDPVALVGVRHQG